MQRGARHIGIIVGPSGIRISPICSNPNRL
jgi:hypothetical protein